MNSGVRRIVKDLRKVFKNGVHEASTPPAMNGHHLKIARKQKKKNRKTSTYCLTVLKFN